MSSFHPRHLDSTTVTNTDAFKLDIIMTFSFLSLLSHTFGWIYTLAWSLSFYPQPLLNLSRRSTSGTTIDFPAINILGFAAYFVSNVAFKYSPLIRAQYAARNNGLTPTVQFNDVVFAGHAVVCAVITTSQYISGLWGWEKTGRRGERVSRTVMGIVVGSILGVGTVAMIVTTHPMDDLRTGWAWIDVIYAISYVKIVVTLVKYMPQVLTNYRNKSTHGWSIYQILLDFVGGVLSLSQLGIDSFLQHDWSGLTGNPVKLALGNIAIVFDIVFMLQHYVLYHGAGAKGRSEGEDDPLLDNERDA